MPQATIAPHKWNAKLVACGAPAFGPGCSFGKVCASTPPMPLSPKLCIFKPGDAACPVGAYAQKTVVFTGAVSDGRGCGACACGASNADCSGKVSIWSDNSNCTSGAVVAQINAPTAACSGAGSANQDYGMKYVPNGTANPTCAPQGGQPTGAATAADPTTVCCTP